ncbi:Cx9C motif-containing protein 4, mitochondrial [Dissophora globulifera]|nr:Cx9C motif-containing protein 4, mitochondrial [Dissophora globulifera]
MAASKPSSDTTQPCHKQACAIQSCLTKNNYQESRCQDVITQLEQCCQALIEAGGSSPSCPVKKYTKKLSSSIPESPSSTAPPRPSIVNKVIMT